VLTRGRVKASVVADHPYASRADHVAIDALHGHAPALDHSGGRDHPLAVHDRLAPERMPEADGLEQRSPLVDVAWRALEDHPVDAQCDQLPVRAAVRAVARSARVDGGFGDDVSQSAAELTSRPAVPPS